MRPFSRRLGHFPISPSWKEEGEERTRQMVRPATEEEEGDVGRPGRDYQARACARKVAGSSCSLARCFFIFTLLLHSFFLAPLIFPPLSLSLGRLPLLSPSREAEEERGKWLRTCSA